MGEGVHAAEALPRPVVDEVSAAPEDRVEGIVRSPAIAVDGLGEGFVGQLSHTVGGLHEGLEGDGPRGLLVPVDAGRRFLTLVAEVAEEGFETLLGEEDGEFEAVALGPLGQGAECIGLPGAAEAHEGDLGTEERSLVRLRISYGSVHSYSLRSWRKIPRVWEKSHARQWVE